MIAFDLLIFAIIAPITIVTAFFAVEVIAGFTPSRKQQVPLVLFSSRTSQSVIPAHD